MEGNIKNLPLVLIGSCTIYSGEVVELRCIGMMVMDHNDPLEENIPYVDAPVIERGLYDGRFEANYHRSGPKLLKVRPSIVTDPTVLD